MQKTYHKPQTESLGFRVSYIAVHVEHSRMLSEFMFKGF